MAPFMKVILVGENPASQIYVSRKQELCRKVGCDFKLVHLPADVEKSRFLDEVQKMNEDEKVTGCFVQLPVPNQLKDIDVTALIAPEKDVDGFGAPSIVAMYKGKDPQFAPCTPKGILALLKHYQIPVAGKSITVIGRSLIVGKPLSLMLQNRGATVTMCHSLTENLEIHTKTSDIIISAVGQAKFLDQKYFRDDQSQVVIDVGMCRDQDNLLCGDVDFENVKKQVNAITPVPGGVGPLTVLSLIENLIIATEHKQIKG